MKKNKLFPLLIVMLALFASIHSAAAQTYTLAVSAMPSAGGTVSGGGTFAAGSQQTVTATANSGYSFFNWTAIGTVVTSTPSYTFALKGNRSLVAHFKPNYTIVVSASPNAGGSVSGGGIFIAASSRTVRATANFGYKFVNWTRNGIVVSSSANYKFTLNGNRTLVAHFRLLPVYYMLTVSTMPSAGGTVEGSGTFLAGSSRTVVATAGSGYKFDNWTENGSVVSSSATYKFTLNGNRTLVANFTQVFKINLSASPSAGGVVEGGGTFDAGTSQTVTATANHGYVFTNWTENGTVVSASESYNFTLDEARTLVAHFTKIVPTLLGTWRGTWAGESAGPEWAGPATTPVSGTWSMDIDSIDITSNTASGTLTWDGTDAYWVYTFDDNGNITSATPEPFFPDRIVSFDSSNTTLQSDGDGEDFHLVIDETTGVDNPSDAFYGPWFSVNLNINTGTVITEGNGFLTHPYDPDNFNTGLSSGTVTGSRTGP